MALEALEDGGADLIWRGTSTGAMRARPRRLHRAGQAFDSRAQSGTTLSARTRDERNSFNSIDVRMDAATSQSMLWDPDSAAFVPLPTSQYENRGEWRLVLGISGDEPNQSCER